MNTPEQIKKMKETADDIQPTLSSVRDRDCEGVSDNDKKIYDTMTEFYKILCKGDIAFNFTFLLPESLKPICFFRYCEPADNKKFQKVGYELNSSLYQFLCYSGYIKYLETANVLKLLPKGEHQSWAEKNKV